MSILIGNWCHWIWCFKPEALTYSNRPTESSRTNEKHTDNSFFFSLKFCFGNKHSNTPFYPSCVSKCIFAVPISHHAHNFHPFCIEITIYFRAIRSAVGFAMHWICEIVTICFDYYYCCLLIVDCLFLLFRFYLCFSSIFSSYFPFDLVVIYF